MFKWAGIVVLILHAFIHLFWFGCGAKCQWPGIIRVFWYLPFVLSYTYSYSG
jgi:hypothetical protein